MSARDTLALLLTAGVLITGCATPHRHADGKDMNRNAMWQKSLARAPLAVTAAFDARGRLWLANVDSGHVRVRHSNDQGKTFSAPVRVNPEPERVAADGENRPKLAFGKHGEVYVSWTQSLDVPFAGHVRYAHSRDGGKTFSTPITVNDDHAPISHRFDSLIVDGAGRVHLVWLDKRAKDAGGGAYAGIALYHAMSANGARFGPNTKLADHTCECCRIAVVLDTDGVPVALWRHVFDKNTRDHALLRLDGTSAMVRASHDDWRVDGCPHHGPALSIGPDGIYHLAWFTGAPNRAGLYYRRSPDRGRSFGAPMRFGNPEAQPGRPQVLSMGSRVVLAWKEFDGKSSLVRAMSSRDGGAIWSAPETLARTAGASDHPQLLPDRGRVFLGWQTVNEGFQLREVAP